MTTQTISARRLEWDSTFFNVAVGQAEATEPNAVADIDAWAHREGIGCLYLLVPADNCATVQAAEARGFYLTGIRATCASAVPFSGGSADAAPAVTIRPGIAGDIEELEAIAANAHSDTRFYADPKFSRDSCERLYRTWIRRSCEGWADHVFVAETDRRLRGYISLHLRGNRAGAIGLFAVASHARRMGVGRALMAEALGWFSDQHVEHVTVATQGQNVAALRAYQRAGFSIAHMDLWLHKWWQPVPE